jgi:hypothetical protein
LTYSSCKNEKFFQIGQSENGGVNNEENVTGRLAANRKIKFDKIWSEFLDKIAELNQVFLLKKKKIIFFWSFVEFVKRFRKNNSRM